MLGDEMGCRACCGHGSGAELSAAANGALGKPGEPKEVPEVTHMRSKRWHT